MQVSDIGQRRKRVCYLCSGDHHLNVCPNFLKKKLTNCTRYIKENRLCFGCFKPNHLSKYCKSTMKCETCSNNHPTSLHDDTWMPREESLENTVVKKRITVGKTNVSSAVSQFHINNRTGLCVKPCKPTGRTVGLCDARYAVRCIIHDGCC